MTLTFGCPSCKQGFLADYLASICTWLGPKWIERLLEESINVVQCPACGEIILLDVPVLINSPNGVFWMNLSETLETKRMMLREYGIIDDNDRIVGIE